MAEAEFSGTSQGGLTRGQPAAVMLTPEPNNARGATMHDEMHDHDRGLELDLPTIMSRRQLLVLGGAGLGAGLLVVAGCGSSASAGSTSTSAAAAASASASTSTMPKR